MKNENFVVRVQIKHFEKEGSWSFEDIEFSDDVVRYLVEDELREVISRAITGIVRTSLDDRKQKIENKIYE